MPFYYKVASGTQYATHATPGTADAWLALRQATRNFNLVELWAGGKAAALTTLSGISHFVRRWTTAGSGGTALTPAPMRIGTTASTGAVDKQTALTPGTTSGAYVGGLNHGNSNGSRWAARDEDDKVTVEAGSSDELAVYSVSGTASLNFDGGAKIEE
jgi:hypothetical protein